MECPLPARTRPQRGSAQEWREKRALNGPPNGRGERPPFWASASGRGALGHPPRAGLAGRRAPRPPPRAAPEPVGAAHRVLAQPHRRSGDSHRGHGRRAGRRVVLRRRYWGCSACLPCGCWGSFGAFDAPRPPRRRWSRRVVGRAVTWRSWRSQSQREPRRAAGGADRLEGPTPARWRARSGGVRGLRPRPTVAPSRWPRRRGGGRRGRHRCFSAAESTPLATRGVRASTARTGRHRSAHDEVR